MRLDKFCSNLWWFTRREAKRAVKSVPIFVNEVEAKSSTKVALWDMVERGDNVTIVKEKVYVLLHKPAWYICSDFAEHGRSSYRALLASYPYVNLLHVAWRLDQNTEWLVLLSSDWTFIHNVISPKKKVPKTYLVHTESFISDDALVQLEAGIEIDDDVTTLPASCSRIDDSRFELTIVEWKYHQVKKMLEAIWNKVIYLKRLSIGLLDLKWLNKWEWRELSDKEIWLFLSSHEKN